MNHESVSAATPASLAPADSDAIPQPSAKVIPLRPSGSWHDPLRLMEEEAPTHIGRIVLWTVSILVLVLIVWAMFGKLDIIAVAEGKLVPQTLVKIVQPAEPGVVKELLVNEGDTVHAGQVLARLDTTLASAEKTGVASDLSQQKMQERRIKAELNNQPMLPQANDDPVLFAQVLNQYNAHHRAFLDGLDQERSLLVKVDNEQRSAVHIQGKLEQTLPTYERSAQAYEKLQSEGFFSPLAAADKQREATEKARDLDAQRLTVAAMGATAQAQRKRIAQIESSYRSELEKELADVRAKIAQLQPSLDKTLYREGLMELKAPQDGVIKDLATTTVGAVVQPGTVVLTLVPKDEQLYADVSIKNEDVGFVQVGQRTQVKLAAYPFQKYGMMTGQVARLSADATETAAKPPGAGNQDERNAPVAAPLTYKARVKLDQQSLRDPQGNRLMLSAGMQVVAEINQGKRTVMEYLLSPVQKSLQEAGRER